MVNSQDGLSSRSYVFSYINEKFESIWIYLTLIYIMSVLFLKYSELRLQECKYILVIFFTHLKEYSTFTISIFIWVIDIVILFSFWEYMFSIITNPVKREWFDYFYDHL